ncbi:glycosyltransferase family 4 protein [Aquabacterium humicola]|uniref:glycosyltransferase family 4 protein n=1 Tax=Aquabacterium humicola TaxID=3237377 RepID=UPI0025435259|nr:glycosyltransferase family 1 protein [Rubrivivax pictus]
MSPSPPLRHVGIGLGHIRHWNDGLGEFSRQLCGALAARADELRETERIALHFHLPAAFQGLFGDRVGYLPTHTLQRLLHVAAPRFAAEGGQRFDLWHTLHQHNRLRAPLGSRRRIETVHDLNFLHTKSGAKRERYRARLARRLAPLDAVVAITHYVAGDLARELPALRTPPVVVHNGATDLTRIAQTRPEGLPERPYLLHVSRLAPTKNIAALLDLAAAWPDHALVLAGATSDYTATVERGIAERGLANVTLRLDISEAEKAWLYAHCEGFLFPSLAEGFGLPPIEAMHFGKPVFLSRLTSLPEVGGDAAYYFDRFDAAHMRAAIEAGLAAHRTPGRAEATTAHARHFAWPRCADAYLGVYRRVLASGRG